MVCYTYGSFSIIIAALFVSFNGWTAQNGVNDSGNILEKRTTGVGEVIVLNNLPFASSAEPSIHSEGCLLLGGSLASVADIAVTWDIFLELAICIKDGFSLDYLVHAIDSVIVFLQPRYLPSQQSNLSLKIFGSHFEVVAFIDHLGVLILVSLQVSLLIFNITSKRRAFSVPEIDLIAILSGRLFKERDLSLQLLFVEIALPQDRFKLLDTLGKSTLVSIVSSTDLSHAGLLTLQSILFL